MRRVVFASMGYERTLYDRPDALRKKVETEAILLGYTRADSRRIE